MTAKRSITETCGTCRFARPLNGNDKAISCQRNPPLITKVEGAQVTSNWPLLGIENWCGEFRRKAG